MEETNKSMNIENVKSQMRKGMLEYCILLLLQSKRAYVSEIINEFKNAKLILVEGTLYPLLTRLKNEGVLGYEWIESNQGPPRKYYYLTETGKMVLKELQKSWDEISSTVDFIRMKNEVIKYN